MNSSNLMGLIVSLSLVTLLVGTNLYWFRRTRLASRGMAIANEWEETEAGLSLDDIGRRSELFEAADQADVRPQELPEEVERLMNKIQDYEELVDSIRENWATSCWNALEHPSIDITQPHAISILLNNGTSDEAMTFAREALNHDNEVAIVVAGSDNSFAVGVGQAMADEYPANTVADRIVQKAGGGGSSGSNRLASGGGADSGTLASAAEDIEDEIEEET